MAASLPDIDLRKEGLSLIVAWRERSTLAAGEIGVDRNVAEQMGAVCVSTLDDLKGRRWRHDDPEAHLAADEYILASRRNLQPIPPVLDVLDRGATLDVLSVATLPRKSLLFYAVIVGTPPHAYTAFVRKHNPHTTLRAGRFAAVFGGDHLSRIDGAVFQFEDSFDLVVTPEAVIVLSMGVYELLFRETEALTARIPRYISTIAGALPLAPGAEQDLQELAMKSPRLQGRLRSLSQRGYLPNVTIEAIIASARKQGVNPDRLVQDGCLILADDDPHLLLQVLNEDLYTGDLSGITYAVDRKTARPES